MFPGSILMGAHSRLLPLSVPLRYFALAAAFHVVTWVLLLSAAPDVPWFVGGPGLPLAALHALTLGVLAMAAVGASLQLLPMATSRPLAALWPGRVAAWLYVPAVVLLVGGFAVNHHVVAMIGALAAAVALLAVGFLVAGVISHTRGLRLVVLHVWGALAALVGLLGLGVALIADMEHGFFAGHALTYDRLNVALTHLVLAVFGFMGLLAMGYSNVLVPMFTLSPSPPAGRGNAALVCAVGALGLGIGGAMAGDPWLRAAAAVLGAAAAFLHLAAMAWALRHGMRKNLGLSFVLIKAAWALMPVSLLVGAAAALDLAGPRGGTLFGFLAVYGWLLTFLLGILQRIVPFLCAMHASKAGQTPPKLSDLAREAPLKVHVVCHFAAIALVAAGIGLGVPLAVAAGAAAGLSGSLTFLWFVVGTVRRTLAAPARVARSAPVASSTLPDPNSGSSP
jgi:hypothetical protein